MSDAKPKMVYNAPRFMVKQYGWDIFVGLFDLFYVHEKYCPNERSRGSIFGP
jgi:hypothetical protein